MRSILKASITCLTVIYMYMKLRSYLPPSQTVNVNGTDRTLCGELEHVLPTVYIPYLHLLCVCVCVCVRTSVCVQVRPVKPVL